MATQPGGMVLPAVSLSLYPMAYITRLERSAMLDVLGQDYIRTARAKGLKNSRVIFKHALKNALGPVITYAGPDDGVYTHRLDGGGKHFLRAGAGQACSSTACCARIT